ncbi:hypothetical protein [Spirosoma fluminis]
MKNVLVFLLLFATLLPTVSPWGTIAYYQVNKAYIARVLCENRSKPELHCDGKCYLAKKLKTQQDKQDKETTERVQNTPTVQLFCDEYASYTFPIIRYAQRSTRLFTYLLATYSAPHSSLFHPPGFAA